MSLHVERPHGGTPSESDLEWYWPAVVVALGAGVGATFGALPIGLPLLFIGLVMLALAPVRRRRERFWPALTAAVLLAFGMTLFAPGSCTSAPTSNGDAGHSVCTSLVGMTYANGHGYLLALLVGVAAGAVGGVAALLVLRKGWRRGAPA